jgi:hypothetical protein
MNGKGTAMKDWRQVMTTEEHRERHKELHKALDELFADYVIHHPSLNGFLELPVGELMNWSKEQTISPTENPNSKAS